MPMLTLEETKLHCRIDGPEEDALLQTYVAAAEDYIRRYCGQNFEAAVPAAVKVACLMIVGGLYENRESMSVTGGAAGFTVNPLVHLYLDQHRINRGLC